MWLAEIAEHGAFAFQLKSDGAGGGADAFGREHLEVRVADGNRDAAFGRRGEVANLLAPVAVGFLAGGEDDAFGFIGPGEREAEVAEAVVVAGLAGDVDLGAGTEASAEGAGADRRLGGVAGRDHRIEVFRAEAKLREAEDIVCAGLRRVGKHGDFASAFTEAA